MSPEPPGPKGTMILIGRDGYCAARAGNGPARSRSARGQNGDRSRHFASSAPQPGQPRGWFSQLSRGISSFSSFRRPASRCAVMLRLGGVGRLIPEWSLGIVTPFLVKSRRIFAARLAFMWLAVVRLAAGRLAAPRLVVSRFVISGPVVPGFVLAGLDPAKACHAVGAPSPHAVDAGQRQTRARSAAYPPPAGPADLRERLDADVVFLVGTPDHLGKGCRRRARKSRTRWWRP